MAFARFLGRSPRPGLPSVRDQPIKKRLGSSKSIPLSFGIVLLTLAGGTWFLLEQTRRTARHAIEATLQNTALVVESVVNRQLLQIDGALVSLPGLFATVAADRDALDAKTAGHLLRSFNFQTFAFRDIIVLRPDGSVWASARSSGQNRQFPIDQFNQEFDVSGGAAVVGGPLRNNVTGEWVLLIARQVLVPKVGALVAVAEVPLPLLGNLLSAVGQIPGLRITLERRSGQLLLSRPYDEMQVGKVQPTAISQIQANGIAFMVPTDLIRKPTIGVSRSTLYPDIMIALTLDLEIAMADWVADRNRMVATVAVAMALLSALAWTLGAAQRQRDRADAERGKASVLLENAIESMSDGFVMWDADDRLVTCNAQYRRLYQLSAAFIHQGARFEDIVRGGALLGQYPQASGDIEKFVADTVDWHRSNHGPMERELPGARWALITERNTPDGCIVGIRTDITDLRRALSDLAEARDRAQAATSEVKKQNITLRERDRSLQIQNILFDAALNNMSQGLLMTDRNQRLIVYNARFLDLFGIDAVSLTVGLETKVIFGLIQSSGRLPAQAVADIHLKQRGLADARSSGTFVVSGDDGRAIAITQRPIADGGWVATYEDVSEQRRAEEQIRFAAHHDALTRLPNRVLFRIRVDEMINNLVYRDTGLALLYLDLDRFKQVNDTLGHPIGDALLEAAGERLLGCVRNGEVVARLGGDEFAVVMTSNELPAAAEALGQRIIAALSESYSLAGHTISVGASIGIALAGIGRMDADTLLKNADMALYQSKSKGRGVCSLFEPDMERQLVARLAIEEEMRWALERNEFELLYQPLYDLGSDRIAGFEALIRWNHAVRGTISPMQFIPIAEETGLICPIGEWVLNQACVDAMKLPNDIKVAVNLSPVQFNKGDIVTIVIAALHASGLPANRLELEITETTLLKNNQSTMVQLAQLQALGLRVALDDFGTGYSSLSYLRSFPFDKIKIDQSFVREMATRSDCAAIVSSVVLLANKLHITTTAEGVETLEQLALIRETGCTEAQGYLFSVPRALPDVLDYFSGSMNLPVENVRAVDAQMHRFLRLAHGLGS